MARNELTHKKMQCQGKAEAEVDTEAEEEVKETGTKAGVVAESDKLGALWTQLCIMSCLRNLSSVSRKYCTSHCVVKE